MSAGRVILDLCSACLVPPDVRVIEFVDGMMALLKDCGSISGSLPELYTIRFTTGSGATASFDTSPYGAAALFRIVLARLAFVASERGGGEFDPYAGEREFSTTDAARAIQRVRLYSNVNRAPFSFTLTRI